MARKPYYLTDETPKTILVAIDAPYNRAVYMLSYFEEFENLVKSDGIPYEHMIVIKLRDIEPATFIGKGKLQTIKDECEERGAERVIISGPY